MTTETTRESHPARDTADEPRPIPLTRSCPFAPPAELTALREREPLSRIANPDGTTGWLVTDHALARKVLGDPRFSARQELMSSPLTARRAEPAMPGGFLFMDPPQHTRYRKLLTGQFTVRRMRRLEARVEEVTERQLSLLRAQGKGADLVEHFALPVPSLMICELLGVPYEDHEFFQSRAVAIFRLVQDPEESGAAYAALRTYLLDLVRRRRGEPADDILSDLVTGSDLTDDELIGMALLLLLAGHETTANMLAMATFALLSHPGQLTLLREDPSLIGGAVEELLRYLSIMHVGLPRAALEDVELADRVIAQGDTVTVSVAAANHDPRKFGPADGLDITRSATGHVAFGHGIHQCLGQQLARIEMRIGINGLLREFPGLRLDVPVCEVPVRSDMGVFGVHRLPVTW
ncbi:cytochrome P450 [Streptomyces durmitorensis]|uniref:Cytochrome P450 n=1 Tax=Streptomyces durmitorensis TaxID=319947 RepID=A0ABY4Q8I2_9ACTN|nr:cytochrome P450 [Streptomyces durmitorensis]UQT61964.1 cytochrome P450 [Streptomyces durmitorensis]